MPELTVAAGLARGLIAFAAKKGADPTVLAERAGIDPAQLQDQDNRVPFAKYVTLMRAAKALCNDPALALHYGEIDDLAEISVLGLIGQACETMSEAFVQLNRYGRLVVEFDGGHDRFKLDRDGAGLWVVDMRENPDAFSELTESTFARMVCGPRAFGVTQIAKAVHVTHAAPAYRAEYDRVFRVPVVFESGKNALLIDEAWLSHKIALQPRYVFGILSERADALIKSLEDSKTTRGRVEALLMPVLHTGDVSMDTIAGKLAMSRQTLFRKLKTEGTSFEKLLDELRHKLALDYLSGKKPMDPGFFTVHMLRGVRCPDP